MVNEALQNEFVVLTEAIDEAALNELSKVSNYTTVANQAELEGVPGEILSRVVAVINRKLHLTDELVRKMPLLKIVARTGVGFDKTRVNLDDLKERKIWLTTNPGNNSTAVAEFTFGLIVSLMRRIHQSSRSIENGKWTPSEFVGYQLEGKTIGVIGFGNIGKKVCTIAKAFSMNVVAYDPYLADEVISAHGAKPLNLEEVLESSDIITLHVPLLSETEYLLDRERLNSLKRGAYIINTARGELIDEEALYENITSGLISGAALDVTAKEPVPPDFPLLQLPNVIMTPHIAGSTKESYVNGAMKAVEEVRRVLSGEIPLNPVYKL